MLTMRRIKACKETVVAIRCMLVDGPTVNVPKHSGINFDSVRGNLHMPLVLHGSFLVLSATLLSMNASVSHKPWHRHNYDRVSVCSGHSRDDASLIDICRHLSKHFADTSTPGV
jgi:hypothetical protein